MNNADQERLCNRAWAAYYRSASIQGGSPMQPSPPEYRTIDGLDYIVLSNTHGILAVYRVRMVNGKPVLKGMKRWPKVIECQSN